MVGAHSYVVYRVASMRVCLFGLFSVCRSFLGRAQFLFILLFLFPLNSVHTDGVVHEHLFSKQYNAQQFGLRFLSVLKVAQ